MQPWHVILFSGVVAAFATASAVLASRKVDMGPPESGTLPAFPKLVAREQQEPGFIRKFLRVVRETGADGDKLAALIDEESGYSPSIRNPIGAVGFMQWLPRYAKAISGFVADDLASMTGLDQLDAVKNSIINAKGYKTDPAMQGWGSHIGSPDDTVIATKDDPDTGLAYDENKGYDKVGKGTITVGDVRGAVYGRLSSLGGKRVGDGGVISQRAGNEDLS